MTERLEEAIREALVDGKLPCGRAFSVAKKLGASPLTVGQKASEMGIHINRCQLGLFGYGPKAEGKHRIVQPAEEVPPDLEAALRAALVDGRLPCAMVWAIAAERKMTRLAVSAAVEALGLRIGPCQLGCF